MNQDGTGVHRMDVYGTLCAYPPEPWLLAVLGSESFPAAMAEEDWDSIESYGGRNESIEVWRHRTRGWIVDWWDTDSRVMLVVIEDKRAYLDFQASWVAPMAVKILKSDEHMRMAEQDAESARIVSELDQADRDEEDRLRQGVVTVRPFKVTGSDISDAKDN